MQVQLIISGLVQGVWFRASAKQEADKLGLKGFVRNIEDDVEAVAIGDEDKVNKFIEWCKKGPSGANVENVEVKDIELNEEFKEFEIRSL